MVKFAISAIAASIIATAAADIYPRAFTIPPAAVIPQKTREQILAQQRLLINTPGESARLNALLPNPPDATEILYTFINNTVTGNTGGTIALTTLNNFPALLTTSISMAVGFVNGCGLNVPHNHPRGNEFLTVTQGRLVGGLILENNNGSFGSGPGIAPFPNGPIGIVNATLTNYTGMLFPQGETHFQFNPDCTPALFVAAFDSSDPGRTQIARNFFSVYPDETLISAVGGNLETLNAQDISAFRKQIPNSFAVLMKDCADRCGIKY